MESDTGPSQRIVGGYEGRFLGLISLATMSGNGAQLLIPPLLPAITRDLAISPAVAGLALSAMWACTALCHYPGGRLSDTLTRKTLLVPSIGVMIVGLSLLTLVQKPFAFFFGVVVLGVGAGLYTPVAFVKLSELYTEKRGLAFGINTASLNLGGFFGAVLAVVSLRFLTWRQAFVPLIGILGIVMVSVHAHSNESYSFSIPAFDIRGAVRRLADDRERRLVVASAIVFGFVWQGLLSFFPTYLEVAKGLSTAIGGVLFGSIFLFGAVITPFAGQVGDRRGNMTVATVSILFSSLGLFIIMIADSLWLVATGTVVLSLGISSFWPVMNSHIMAVIPTKNRGGDYGVVRTVFIAAESAGPLYLGLVSQFYTYAAGFGTLFAFLAVSFVVTAFAATVSDE